jgi:glycosyltransferase involved in cell wall biosynthesis
MKSVLLRAPVLTESGYGVHARQIARWLLKKPVDLSVQTLPWGDTPWIIDPDRESGLIRQLMDRTGNQKSHHDVTFQLQLPNEWNPSLGSFNVGVTAAVETDRCNPEWIPCCNRMDVVVVPSEHTKKVLQASGKLEKPVIVIPESFADACGQEEVKPIELDLSTQFNFLIFGQLTGNNPKNDRKNIFFTIKWLCDVFKNDSQVGIVIKTNTGRMTKIDKKICTDMFKQILKEARQGPNPKFHLIHGMMQDEDVAGLYRHPKIKALVTLTRGEGFGLPILEAAASGLPVIATNWSGHMDFMQLGKFVNVDYELKEIDPSRVDNKLFMKGSRWAEVVEDDFKRRMKKFKESSSVPREWAVDLQKKVRKEFSFEAVSHKWEEALGEKLV